MPRPKPLAWSGVRIGAKDGTSGAMIVAQDGMSDVTSGARVQLRPPAPERVRLPAPVLGQNSNSTGAANSLVERLRNHRAF
jgi:hypothetical protein